MMKIVLKISIIDIIDIIAKAYSAHPTTHRENATNSCSQYSYLM